MKAALLQGERIGRGDQIGGVLQDDLHATVRVGGLAHDRLKLRRAEQVSDLSGSECGGKGASQCGIVTVHNLPTVPNSVLSPSETYSQKRGAV